MSSNSIKFSCTALQGTNKVGNLPKDENGYYTVVLGGLNMFNSYGAFYVYEEAKALFEGSSHLMRRVKDGVLRGEYGHPKRSAGESDREFMVRVNSLHEQAICCHFKEIWLDFDLLKTKDDAGIIAIMGKVKPSGAFGPALEKSFQNKDENVCFSIRSFTEDFVIAGQHKKILKEIVTWDYVNEPGLHVAKKWNAPALESLDESIFFRSQTMESMVGNGRELASMESMALSPEQLFKAFGWEADKQALAAFRNWK